MPELPEVETVRRTLKNFIIGKEITEIRVHYDKIVSGNTDTFVTALTGQTILDIDRGGKYLFFILDQDAFISHLRMEGKYNIVDASKPLSKQVHLQKVCPVCNGAVIKKMVRGRGTYYCPTCQKKKG